jgi:TPR repeat protein
MYAYRVKGDQLELIASDTVVYSRVAASGSGDNAAYAELGAGIGNLIRASGDRHRGDKLYEEALKAICADAQDNGVKQDALSENHALEETPTSKQDTPAAPTPHQASPAASALSSPAQVPENTESAPSAESIATLKEQAAGGDAKAQYILGEAYENGEGVSEDDTQAAFWYRKAAEQENALAQFDLGGLYYDGKGVTQDYAQAAIWYRKAAEQGDAAAQSNLGLMYVGGRGVPKDASEAARWFRKAAEQSLAVAQFSLGTLYYDGSGVPQNSAQAAIWYRKAAEQGNPEAQDELGGLYEFGRGVPQNDAQAALWFRKAAEQGDAKAQWELGADYASGQGVPQDYAEAYFWLDLAAASTFDRVKPEDATRVREGATKTRDLVASLLTPADLSREQERARKWFEDHAADMQRTPAAVAPISAPAVVSASEDAETQFHRGTLYETGKGVQQDYAQAVLWYRKAAEQNLAIAQYRLGVLYANGVGVPLDKSQAAAWFQKAAEQGYVYAQEMLGSDYLTGEGVQRDYAEAYFWFDIACASKAREVVAGMRATERDAAAFYLKPAALSREQERARKWFEDHPAKP